MVYGSLAGTGGMGLLYSTSFLHAGFLGLGALWLASYMGHGGFGGHGGHSYPAYGGGYGGGYNDFGGGGYGPPHGGYGPPHGGYGPPHGGYGPPPHGGYSSPKDGYGPPHGGYGHDGHGRRSYARSGNFDENAGKTVKRMKRAVEQVIPLFTQAGTEERQRAAQSSNTEEEQLLNLIKINDSQSCSLRLVCELSAIKHRFLERDEWEILKFVRSGDALYDLFRRGQGVPSNSPVLDDYKRAGLLGRMGGACAERFSLCSYSAEEMMLSIRSV